MALVAIHPGEHLAEELRALGVSASELARRIKVPTNRVTGILNGLRGITVIPPSAWRTSSAPAPSSG